MAGSQSVFSDPFPLSDKLWSLVQDQLLQAPHTNTIEDVKTTVETLFIFTSACESVLNYVSTQDEETDLETAVKMVENVLFWNNFVESVGTIPSNIDFLFRAHTSVDTSHPTFCPDKNLPFDLEYRLFSSLENFASELKDHLSKTQKEKETGVKPLTIFVSMSPMLEWTLHTTGQKCKGLDQNSNEVAGLAIFDVDKLRQSSETAIFRVSNILDFLASQNKGQLIPEHLQTWARNCDEYVSMGRIPDNGLVRWLEWSEVVTLPALLFLEDFTKTFTLGWYRKWTGEKHEHVELKDISQKIVETGSILAGPRHDLLAPMIKLILKPGIRFWGFKINSGEEEIVRAKIQVLIDEAALPKLSGLSL